MTNNTNDILLDFPPLKNDGLDAMIRMYGTYSRVKELTDAQAAAQAAVLKPLVKHVICEELLPAVTCDLFNFYFKSYISQNRLCAYGRIMARCMHPAFKNSTADVKYKLISVDYNFLDFTSRGTGLTDEHINLMVYLRMLEFLFDNQSLHVALDVSRENHPPVPNTVILESSINLKFKLPTFQTVPDLISWLGGNGYDLTSVQPFLSI